MFKGDFPKNKDLRNDLKTYQSSWLSSKSRRTPAFFPNTKYLQSYEIPLDGRLLKLEDLYDLFLTNMTSKDLLCFQSVFLVGVGKKGVGKGSC